MNRDSGNGHRAALSQETKEQEAAVEKARTWSYHHASTTWRVRRSGTILLSNVRFTPNSRH